MHTLTKLSGSALCAALLAGSSDIAARAQNALTTVSSQGMSESTTIRVGCGIGAPDFIDAVNQTAYSQNLFSMPIMVGVLAGISVAYMLIAILPAPLRAKVIKTIKTTLKVGFYFNTSCVIASLSTLGGNLGTLAVILVMLCISAFLSRKFWGEFFTCLRMPASNFTGFDRSRAESAVRRVAPRAVPVQAQIPVLTQTVSVQTPPLNGECFAEVEAAVSLDMTPEQIEHFRARLTRQFHPDQTESGDQSEASDTTTSTREDAELLCLSR